MFRTINQSIRKFSSNMCSTVKCRRFEGKTAMVTGSTEGIGFAIARRLAQEGARVIISSRKEANVKKALEQAKCEDLDIAGLVCHIGKAEDRKKLYDKVKHEFGTLDVLVSNVGISPVMDHIIDVPESVWDKVMITNVKVAYLLLKEYMSLLRCSKSPSVIFISSIVGYQPMDHLGMYSISKTALLGLTKVCSNELACEGIRVNCIAPGIIRTKFSAALYDTEEAYETAMQAIIMKRLGEADEIASVAAFLASDDASYITGETIVAAGGMKSKL